MRRMSGSQDHIVMYESWVGTTLDGFNTLQNPRIECLLSWKVQVGTDFELFQCLSTTWTWGGVGTMDHREYESWLGTTLDGFSTLQNPQMMCLCVYRMDMEITLLNPQMVLPLYSPSNGSICVRRMTFLSWFGTILDGFNTLENPHIHHSPTSIGDSSLEICPLPPPLLNSPFPLSSSLRFSSPPK